MTVTHTFNLLVPSVESTLANMIGSNPDGFVVQIHNQDSIGSLVYKFQKSSDGGTTWEDIEFNEVSLFTLTGGDIVFIRITDTAPNIRLRAYGNLRAQVSVTSARNITVPVQISL